MKPLRKHTTFGHRRNPAEATLEQSATRAFGTAHKQGISLKTKFYRATHGEFHYPSWHPTKIQAIGLIVLLSIGILFLVDQNFKGPASIFSKEGGRIHDPDTIIWQATNPTHDLSEFNTQNFQERTNFFSGVDTLETNNHGSIFDTYAFSNRDGDNTVVVGGNVGQCFNAGYTGTLSSTKLMLKATLPITGTGTVRIHATSGSYGTSCVPSGATLATADSFDMSTLTTTYTTYTFSFTGVEQISLTSGTKYAVGFKWETGGTGGPALVGNDNTSPSHAGNEWRGCATYPSGPTGCTNDASVDLVFEVDSTPVTPHTAVAITKAQVGDLSVVSSKAMSLNFSWYMANIEQDLDFGMFLTTNGTLPTQSGYDPIADGSVTYLLRIRCSVSCTASQQDWIVTSYALRVLGQQHTISNEATELITTTECAGSSSCFLRNPSSTLDGNPATRFVKTRTLLNYTGTTQSNVVCTSTGSGDSAMAFGPGCSSIISVDGTATSFVATKILPHFQFQGQQYFMGIYMLVPINPATQLEVAFQQGPLGTLAISTYNTGVAAANPPNIDTGGFFGPIVKALINIGVWIYQNLLLAFTFVAGVIETAGNSIGRFFGLGNLGTVMISFLTGVANFIANVLTTVFGWSVTFASLFAGSIAVFSNFIGGSFGFVGWIISWFTSLSGIWQIVQDFWNSVNTVVLSMNAILVFYYIIGMFMVYMDGWKGFREWLEIGETFTLKLLKLGWWIGNEMRTVILDVKQLIVNWL